MARVQPVLSETETAIINQVASLTHTRRTEVIKNALAVYHWFVRQAVVGARVVARKATGEEVTLETAELAVLEGRAQLLSPKELSRLGKQLERAKDSAEVARLRERLARGFYGL